MTGLYGARPDLRGFGHMAHPVSRRKVAVPVVLALAASVIELAVAAGPAAALMRAVIPEDGSWRRSLRW
jgi:hypothetical protein